MVVGIFILALHGGYPSAPTSSIASDFGCAASRAMRFSLTHPLTSSTLNCHAAWQATHFDKVAATLFNSSGAGLPSSAASAMSSISRWTLMPSVLNGSGTLASSVGFASAAAAMHAARAESAICFLSSRPTPSTTPKNTNNKPHKTNKNRTHTNTKNTNTKHTNKPNTEQPQKKNHAK